jgi:ABC-type sugar transport system permease subunit
MPVLTLVLFLSFRTSAETNAPIELRAWGVPDYTKTDVNTLAQLQILDAFQKRYPNIKPVTTAGLEIPGRTLDMVPLMQIAGDIAPEVMYINFRKSDTYISNKFLYPLDKYIEHLAGTDIPGGQLLPLPEYLSRLHAAPHYQEELADRVPEQCWEVMRRPCPYGDKCPYLKAWGEPASAKHYHTWCFPQGPLVIALFYRRDYFHEAGLPDRPPETMEELLQWARILTNPKADRYGLMMDINSMSWGTLSFLYSNGGRLVQQDANGQWRCSFDNEAAVEAYDYVARLFLEPYQNKYGKFNNVVYLLSSPIGSDDKYAMFFGYLDQRFFAQYDPSQWGFGAVPLGPTGIRGSEFNSMMTGIYAGLENDVPRRDAAWDYIRFYDGLEARKIRAKVFVENGYGEYIRPAMLEAAGYPEYIRRIPKGWEETFQLAMQNGVPEPYGKNCEAVYRYASQAINQIRTDATVEHAIEQGDTKDAKARIREILRARVRSSDERMLHILTPEEAHLRRAVATIVTVVIITIFAVVFRRVWRVFTPEQSHVEPHRRGWQFSRYKWAYLIMLPAVGTIALWAYYPLARGSVMAFQDYNVRGFVHWIGMDNIATVLFDDEFWYAMWVSLKYASLFMVFGFVAPIVLAFLLTEVPRGKLLFRSLYYLPAVLSGVVVIFLWKGFYGSQGMINQVLNFFVSLFNHLPHVHLAEVHTSWLESPQFALFFCLLPIIWAGMGPGCLIYLAALKTVPEDLYEAADIDGAGVLSKIFSIALPSIKSLVTINFIGVIIATIKGGGEFILAMTGGGPYTPYGETEVVGLHIFWQAFGFLRFGAAVAMGWVLGSFLIGFTVLQLQRLSRMEFRTASAGDK